MRDGGGPKFLCELVPGGRAWVELKSAAARVPLKCPRPDAQVCGFAQATTDGGRRAPFALGDDDERVTRGLRIESLAAAAACAFFPRELVG